MTSVYIVQSGDIESASINGVFRSIDAARECAIALAQCGVWTVKDRPDAVVWSAEGSTDWISIERHEVK